MNWRLSPHPAANPAAFFVALTLFVTSGCTLFRTGEPNLGSSPLAISLALDPESVVLPEHRRVLVTASLTNTSRRLVNLDFPNSQRVEMLLKDPDGRTLTTWSEDQLIEPIPGNLALNPGEKAVYQLELPTRGMLPGRDYRVEVFVPAHPHIRGSAPIAPRAQN